MHSTLRSLLCGLAVAFAVAAPASAQQQVTTDPSEIQAPVCSATGDAAPTCTSGDSAPADPAQGPVGGGQVITDPAGEVDGDGTDALPDPPKQGEQHVLGGRATASLEPSDHAAQTAPAATQPQATPAAVPAPQEAPAVRQRASAAQELPFTGVNAALLAAIGASMLLAGLALKRSAARV